MTTSTLYLVPSVADDEDPLPATTVFRKLFAVHEVMASSVGFFDSTDPHVARALATVDALDFTGVASEAEDYLFAMQLLTAAQEHAATVDRGVFTAAMVRLSRIREDYVADLRRDEARYAQVAPERAVGVAPVTVSLPVRVCANASCDMPLDADEVGPLCYGCWEVREAWLVDFLDA